MAFHTYPLERADQLEDQSRFRFCSREELVGALAPSRVDIVADLGSGTGFYTDEVAPFVDTCYAIDIQAGMHERYREKGVPDNVDPVTASISELPFPDAHLDAVFSTMTYHEFATIEALTEVHRCLAPGGRFLIVDWTSEGTGDVGPPLGERFDADRATEQLAGSQFAVKAVQRRPETFLVVASAGPGNKEV